MTIRRSLLTSVFLLLASAPSHPQDWPSFRGPGARGVADGHDLPADWDVATSRNVRWKQAVPGVGHSSPIVSGDRVVLNPGLEVETGSLVYRERTGATHSASPVASDGKVYVAAEEGQVLVLRAGRTFEVLARNDMGETMFATPAIAQGTLFVRTRGHLYAIGARPVRRS